MINAMIPFSSIDILNKIITMIRFQLVDAWPSMHMINIERILVAVSDNIREISGIAKNHGIRSRGRFVYKDLAHCRKGSLQLSLEGYTSRKEALKTYTRN